MTDTVEKAAPKAVDETAFEQISFKRPTRRLPTRESVRDGEQRPSISFNSGSRFNVPKEVKDADPDHVYAFVPYMAANQPWQESVDSATERGYWPVTKTEHPKLEQRYVTDLYGKRDDSNNDYIRRGGQILMKRPKYLNDMENEEFQRDNQRHNEMSKNMVLRDESYRGPLNQFWRYGANAR